MRRTRGLRSTPVRESKPAWFSVHRISELYAPRSRTRAVFGWVGSTNSSVRRTSQLFTSSPTRARGARRTRSHRVRPPNSSPETRDAALDESRAGALDLRLALQHLLPHADLRAAGRRPRRECHRASPSVDACSAATILPDRLLHPYGRASTRARAPPSQDRRSSLRCRRDEGARGSTSTWARQSSPTAENAAGDELLERAGLARWRPRSRRDAPAAASATSRRHTPAPSPSPASRRVAEPQPLAAARARCGTRPRQSCASRTAPAAAATRG